MDLKTYVEELRELVNIDSGTTTVEGVAQVAAAMEKKYKSIGWHAEIVPLGEGVGPAVFATNKPGAQKYDALLVGHMDTVFPAGTVAERPMTTDDTCAYGPGVADMKGGLLNAFWAMRALEKADSDRLAIAVAMNPDEEVGSGASKEWLGELARKSRCAFIIEPARGEGGCLVKARKGMGRFRFDFAGRAAHAGNAPEKGRSAIHELAHWILAIIKLADAEKGTTVNVGMISGGDAANIVADKASATLDIRYWHNEEYTRIEAALNEMAKKPFTPDVGVTIISQSSLPAMYPTPEMEKLMKLVESCGEKEGVVVRWLEAGGGSDGNHIAVLGTPVLDGFGPVGGDFHSPKEFLELDSVMPRIALLKRTVSSL